MFAYIKGIISYKDKQHLVIDVGGIGYKLSTSLTTLESIGALGDQVKVYTHLYVREDIMNIYGFSTKEELRMFELLISVSGVGPKAAISMISSVPASKFGIAVVSDDSKTLTKAQGIGEKTARRIILELKDKIKNEQLIEEFIKDSKPMPGNLNNSAMSEAVSALMVLGYSSYEANKAVSAIYSDGMDVEIIIRESLKMLSA